MDPDADMLDLTAPSSTSPPPPSSDIVDSPIIPSTTSTAEIPKQNALKNSNKPKPVSTAKPRTSKPARSPSPSPPPQPVRPPLQTIRLVIKLGGPDNYEVNLAELAKSTGQRAPTPVPVKRDTSESEGEGDDDEAKDQPKEKKKRKKNVTVEFYDTSDPFIDDSELPMDERTFFAQTKQQGFYVSSGEVALMKDNPKKPKSRKSLGAPINGSRESPIAVGSDNEDDKKRKSSEEHGDGSKKRKTAEVRAFHPDLEAAIEELKVEIAKESWAAKGKFPPSLKPVLGQVALKAVVLGEYDDNFFNIMPKLFPYNKFTMTKLIKRTIWKEHMVILTDRQTELLDELATLTKEGFPKAKEEWEKSVIAWEKKQEKLKAPEAEADTGEVSGDATAPESISAAPLPSQAIDDGTISGAEQDPTSRANASAIGSAKETHAPAKKFKMTEPIKNIIWQLVCLSNECCRIENERNGLENTGQTVSELGVRKLLYQKIMHAFPDGWISSGQISREVSSLKKRFEKESLADD